MSGFDQNVYCDFDSVAAQVTAGKDILLAIFNAEGTKLLAVHGQKGLSLKRSAETIDVSSKDTKGGWKASIPGMKEWSIDLNGVYVPNEESHILLGKAFNTTSPVCVKVVNMKTKKGLYGGLACITSYDVEMAFDSAANYSISLKGMGALVDFETLEEEDKAKVTSMPA